MANPTAPAPLSLLAFVLAGVGVAPSAADIAADRLDRAVARAAYLRSARTRLGYGRRADAVTLDIIDADRAVSAARAALDAISAN